MPPDPRLVEDFRRHHGLDRTPERRRIWVAQLGTMAIPLPNFAWRREIIAQHDWHHVVTGYPPDLLGELYVAAWECGARCYADWRARSLCRGLMLLGLLLSPRATMRAFRRGQAGRT